mmetsp:Transcript_28660/g.59451  ORF Transcript_28660/g.59451 Transcript_28660/m.59451 type:complete len:346 (-) Transcript_28660:190-1227(-)
MDDISSVLSTGKWSALECEQFEEGVIEHGWGNWTAINEMIPTRKRSQIKSHAQKVSTRHSAKKKKLEMTHAYRTLEQYWAYSEWTEDERARFERAVAVRGWDDWCGIAREILGPSQGDVGSSKDPHGGSSSTSRSNRKSWPQINDEVAAVAGCKKRAVPQAASLKSAAAESKKRKTDESESNSPTLALLKSPAEVKFDRNSTSSVQINGNASSASTRKSPGSSSVRETGAGVKVPSSEKKDKPWMDEAEIKVLSRNQAGVNANEVNAWRMVTGHEINDFCNSYDYETDDEFNYESKHLVQTRTAPALHNLRVNRNARKKDEMIMGASLVALGLALLAIDFYLGRL